VLVLFLVLQKSQRIEDEKEKEEEDEAAASRQAELNRRTRRAPSL
jgi:hypothetical protein